MPAEVKLIKRVAAVGGDRVCAEEGAVRTPSRVSPVLARDRRGVALPTWDGPTQFMIKQILTGENDGAAIDLPK